MVLSLGSTLKWGSLCPPCIKIFLSLDTYLLQVMSSGGVFQFRWYHLVNHRTSWSLPIIVCQTYKGTKCIQHLCLALKLHVGRKLSGKISWFTTGYWTYLKLQWWRYNLFFYFFILWLNMEINPVFRSRYQNSWNQIMAAVGFTSAAPGELSCKLRWVICLQSLHVRCRHLWQATMRHYLKCANPLKKKFSEWEVIASRIRAD